MKRSLGAGALLLLCLAGCGDDAAGGPTACEIGPDILSQSIAALIAAEPACASDADCVVVDTDVDCAGFSAGLCGTIMHRSAAAKWSADDVCEQIDDASSPSKYSCSDEASCASLRPACVNHACAGMRQ